MLRIIASMIQIIAPQTINPPNATNKPVTTKRGL